MRFQRFNKTKALGDEAPKGGVVIEGYANKFFTDAYNERMDPTSVKLDRFKQNPILLFNHDMMYPCGKVLAVEAREDGVFVRACVSASGNDKVSFVRDLVEDGTLCTFSIRFADETVVEDPEVQGGKLIKDWELQEVSIVSIPAQPDSTFSLANVKSVKDLRAMTLKAKGAMVAKLAADAMAKLEEAGQEKEDLLEKLGEASGQEPADLAEVLAGNVTPVPEPVLSAIVSVLGVEENELKEANAQDVEKQKSLEGEEKPEEKMDEEKPAEEKAEEVNPLEQAVQECVSEKIPKLLEEGMEQEQAVATAISMCSKEKGCATFVPTREMMTKWLSDCDNVKQAEQNGQSKETTPVPSEFDMNENGLLALMKSQLELLGAISAKLDGVKDAILEMSSKAEVERAQEAAEQPAEMDEEKTEPEQEEQMKKLLDEYEAKLKAILA